MSPADAPARSPEAVTLPFDGHTIVYHRATGEVHRLDAVGSIVWQFLDGQTTVESLTADLADAFQAGRAQGGADVTALLDRLERLSLLEGGPSPEPRTGPVVLTNPPSP